MHRQANELVFSQDIKSLLIGLYLTAALMNFVTAYRFWARRRRHREARPRAQAVTWSLVGLFFLALVLLATSDEPSRLRWISFSASFRNLADRVMGPLPVMLGSMIFLGLLYRFRAFFTRPTIAWSAFNLSLLCLGFSLPDPDFAALVLKPDNIPIVGLIYLLAFFTWLSARKAVLNDDRLARGQRPLEAEDGERVLVWPDLVYIELISMVAVTGLLLIWSITVKAPLEAEASTVVTPNPSKAPWYFLGLQEMLLYFDPWMAGVVLPSLIIFGLCAIPYVDVNKKGSGYYTIQERRFAYLTFQFGFLILWILSMLIGTFFRGPNWSFFGFFETWDVHKVAALNNVPLSRWFWIDWLNRPLPEAPDRAAALTRFCYALWRELPGLVLLFGYFFALPLLLTTFNQNARRLCQQMGSTRYLIVVVLLLLMLLLPIKMVCRWSFNLSYFVSIPEYSFNF